VRVSQQRGEDNCNGRLDFPDGKLLLPTDLNEIPKLNAFVEEVCREVSFNQETTGQIKTAVGEAVVNVMKYAYPPGQHGDVTIEAASNNLRLKFTVIDCGRPFDPTTQTGFDTPTAPGTVAAPSAEERSVGGMGILIMRQNMDSINYERLDNLNILTLRKELNVE